MSNDTKDRILKAALEIFSRDGYAGANLKDIAEAVGVVKSGFYRHYAGKEELWNAVLDEMERYYNERFGSLENLPAIPQSTDELKALTLRMLDFTIHDEKIIMTRKILLTEQFRDARVRALATKHFYTGLRELFTGIFAGMMENGSLRKGDPSMLAFVYTAPVSTLVQLCDREPERYEEVTKQIEAFVEHFIRIYGALSRRNKMNVIYEHKKELTFIGFHTEIAPDEGNRKCPEFWDREYNEKYARLWQTMKPETPVEAAILENGIGMYAICADGENGFAYWIAGLYKGGEVPEGLELFTFPESDWAVFSAKGPIPESLQTLNAQVWSEWAPNIRAMYETGPSSLEIYSAMNPQSPDYECGIWVPIRKKADLKICQSCGMPMESEEVFGTNADGSINEDYCKYCYTNGEFVDKVSMEEYIEMCSQFGAQAGMTNEEMKAYCQKLFPTLKRWK